MPTTRALMAEHAEIQQDAAEQQMWSGEGDMLHQADVSLALSPATVAAAEVRVADLSKGTEIVVIEIGGISMQSYRCDTLEIAHALRRLAQRVASAALDHRQSKTQDPML